MEKIVVSVLGQDRPGIVAAVTDILYRHDCNIRDLTQTILRTEFAAILLVDCPASCLDVLEEELAQTLKPMGMSVFLRPAPWAKAQEPKPCLPLVITTSGPDCSGQVARVSQVINEAGGNITELKAVSHQDDVGLTATNDKRFTMIFETDFPLATEQAALRKNLGLVCKELGLEYSVQHREIFESIHRI